jgi:hypothetical protein
MEMDLDMDNLIEEKMTKKQILSKLRKIIILANHPKCKTYEEALEKELLPGCRLMVKGFVDEVFILPNNENYNLSWSLSTGEPMASIIDDDIQDSRPNAKWYKMHKNLGLPIGLGRVLNAISNMGDYDFELYTEEAGGIVFRVSRRFSERDYFIKWDFRKQLDEQLLETLRELLEVLKNET